MYLSKIHIQNIKSLEDVTWEMEDIQQAPGWHVILGNNGSGKTTFVRSVALALVGHKEAGALRQNWSDWLRQGPARGTINLTIISDSFYDRSISFNIPEGQATVKFRRNQNGYVSFDMQDEPSSLIDLVRDSIFQGWFSASYGPYRRFSGGDQDYEKMFYSNPRLAPHLSAFGESVALTEVVEWLKGLRFKELENSSSNESTLLKKIIAFVNHEGFLPNHTSLERVSSKGVHFKDGTGCDIEVDDLSDGYRSILSMTFELIRQMSNAYTGTDIFSTNRTQIIVPGVVLIDEVDAHLHPSWQRQIGHWFRRHFPKVQFIVTTHSPLVCQAASTVFVLPNPGSQGSGSFVTGTDLDRLRYGNILEAYSTEAFGSSATRSQESQQRMERLAELNIEEMSRELTQEERKEQEQLRATLPTSAHSQSTGVE